MLQYRNHFPGGARALTLTILSFLCCFSIAPNPVGWIARDSTLDHHANGDFDIRGSLICDGDFPRFWWINFPVVGPTSLLQICASTLFGGIQAFANAYCGWPEQEVVFQPRDDFREWTRLNLYCRTKCFCDHEGDSQPINNGLDAHIIPQSGVEIFFFDTGQLRWYNRREQGTNLLPLKFVDYHEMDIWEAQHLPQPGALEPNSGYEVEEQYTTGARQNSIRCSKLLRLPVWLNQLLAGATYPLPIAYNNAQELCAHRFYRGNIKGNLGGICMLAGNTRRLEFPEELSHPDFIRHNSLSAQDLLVAATHIWCHTRCYCTSQAEQREPTVPPDLLIFPVGGYIDLRNGGCIITNSVGEVNVLVQPGLHPLAASEAGSCEGSVGEADAFGSPIHCGDNTCCAMAPASYDPMAKPAVIPAGEPGTGIQRPKLVAAPLRGLPRKTPKAGDACTGPEDCKGIPGARRDYQCIEPSSSLIAKFGLGLDPVAPTSICWTLALASELGRKRRLSGRSEIMENLACACNATYISAACCDSEDGLVWEGTEMKLGSLKL